MYRASWREVIGSVGQPSKPNEAAKPKAAKGRPTARRETSKRFSSSSSGSWRKKTCKNKVGSPIPIATNSKQIDRVCLWEVDWLVHSIEARKGGNQHQSTTAKTIHFSDMDGCASVCLCIPEIVLNICALPLWLFPRWVHRTACLVQMLEWTSIQDDAPRSACKRGWTTRILGTMNPKRVLMVPRWAASRFDPPARAVGDEIYWNLHRCLRYMYIACWLIDYTGWFWNLVNVWKCCVLSVAHRTSCKRRSLKGSCNSDSLSGCLKL